MPVPELSPAANDISRVFNDIVRQTVSGNYSPEFHDPITSVTDRVDAILATSREEYQRAVDSGKFSDVGLLQIRTDLNDRAAQRLIAIRKDTVDALSRRIDDASAKALQPFTARPDAVDAIREMETRQQLASLDIIVLQQRYLSASRSGDPEVLIRAVENAPLGPMVSAEILKEGRSLQMARVAPFIGEWAAVRDLYQQILANAWTALGVAPSTEPQTI